MAKKKAAKKKTTKKAKPVLQKVEKKEVPPPPGTVQVPPLIALMDAVSKMIALNNQVLSVTGSVNATAGKFLTLDVSPLTKETLVQLKDCLETYGIHALKAQSEMARILAEFNIQNRSERKQKAMEA